MIIRITHLRQAGMCARVSRVWARDHGIDWSDFVTNGVDEEVLLATGDAMALRVVGVAHNGE